MDPFMIAVTVFVLVASLIGLIALSMLGGGKTDEVAKSQREQLESLSDEREILPDPSSMKLGSVLMPSNPEERKKLSERLIQAGLYGSHSVAVYIITKAALIAVPIAGGIAASFTGLFGLSLTSGFLYGTLTGVVGMVASGFWLDYKKSQRQTALRRALPDALDIVNVCLEGGLSLPGAVERVSKELRTAHPLLAAEMAIVQREIQMGYSSGEALKRFAERADLNDVSSLASVVLQAERYGASVVKPLRVHAEGLRKKRMQRAEEMAQKASVKLLFPTFAFIFPALFIVLAGPAVFDVFAMFEHLGQ